MRSLPILAVLVFAACSHTKIGPDDASIGDAALVDGALPDGATPPDGSAPDGGGPDGGNAKGDQGFTGGSRLQVRYYVGSDGSEQALGFYDSQRKENCTYATATDSVIRCLPDTGSLLNWFTDSGCTQPALVLIKGCAPPSEARIIASTSPLCGYQYKYAVMTVGSAYSGALYQGTTTNCTAAGNTSTLSASYDTYSTTGVVSASSFQDATEVVK